ncbi:aminotransferase class I/II-fold pyridoxal phosphate-dependent enzyme [bacterium]|nr:aminotransferase class I/II-fold pyridoxal phosphate-dependent enzyme [bacterium]
MPLQPFTLERYFAKHEFSARYLLSSSDCEPLPMTDLLAMASDGTAALWHDLTLAYTESAGHPLLREMIASIYRGLNAEDILTAAPEEIIYLFMNTFLEPGDHVVSTFPGYQSLYELARARSCRLSFWKPREEEGWAFTAADLEALLEQDTKLVVMNFPHNPTGYVPPAKEYEKMVRMATDRGALVFSDEMYRFLEIVPGTTLPAACELSDRAVSLFGLSKSFGLPGLRTGWLACRDGDILRNMQELKDYTTICGSAPSEILAMIALENRVRIITGHIERVRKNLALLQDFGKRLLVTSPQDLSQVTGQPAVFELIPPVGGSVCFPRLPGVGSTFDFCERLVNEASIMLLPSKLFEWDDTHVRIGLGRENFPEVLERFVRYL